MSLPRGMLISLFNDGGMFSLQPLATVAQAALLEGRVDSILNSNDSRSIKAFLYCVESGKVIEAL